MYRPNWVIEVLLIIAILLVIFCGTIYIQKNVTANCTDFLFWRHCGVTTPLNR